MLTSARKTMPALDYVSIIRSVYGDRRAMLAGVFVSALTAGMTAYKTDSIPLYAVTIAFIIIGLIRYADMRAFWHAAIDSNDAAAAEHWENRAVLSGGLLALVYGIWCLVSMAVVKDPFAELASASISIAVMVGICARNFGLDRLVTIQMVLVIVPLSAGYALHGDIYHAVLATLLGIMLSSFRKLAGDIRAILLSAVHGRVEASRLADELDTAITTLEHGLCMIDQNGVITLANERAVQTFARLDIPQLVGRPAALVLATLGESGQASRSAVNRLTGMIARRQSGKVLLSIKPARHFEVTISARQAHIVLLFENISERVAAEERISYMARHDALTGLPNRSYFGELAVAELEQRRATGQSAALMIIDIDEFKHVNDSLGHVVGDALLHEVAQRLSATVPGAILGRLGGDEFIVLCSHGELDASARTHADRIQAAFEAPFALDGVALSAKISIGLVTSADSAETMEELLTKADLALYVAKSEGRGRNQVFHGQMDIDYHYRQRLKTDLRAAVAAGGLTLAFQPLVDLPSRKVVSCEALARWDHDEFGSIPPATFIPLAEEMGLISDITAWVITNATRECSNWAGDIGVAVNVSARDFRGGDLLATIDRALAESGLAAERLEIEVTETAVIEQREIAQGLLECLASRGISIALDDFGTGYSSLSYLSALPFNKLKIDRSFVVDIATRPRALSLLANVARLGRDLDLTVVAEGVETEEQLDIMVKHTRVQQVQGYFFSRPLPARDIAELIARLNNSAKDHPARPKHNHG